MSIAREKAEKQARKEKRMAVQAEWQKENTTQFTIRLQNSTDADIIEKLEAAESRQGELKRLVRLGIAYEQQGGAIQGVSAPAPATTVDRETQRLARVGAEYEDMLRRGWVMVEPEKQEEATSSTIQEAIENLRRGMEERRAKAEKTE